MTQVESDDTDSGRYMTLRVASPFDYERQARIFLPDLPDPRDESWGKQVADLTGELVRAAGGRTLVLCTSNVAVSRISAALASADVRILTQGDQPRGALLDGFRADPTSVLVATMGFWEGVDIVGDACQMVVIDRIPFPRPDDPLWRARRSEAEAAGLSAFNSVDLPRAASLTAQGAGRLIRSMDDLGMIVICDRRIRSKGYGKRILQTLPEMPVITDHADALSYLESLSNA